LVNTASKKEDKNKGLTLIFNFYNMKKFIKEYLPYLLIIIFVIILKMYVVTPVRVRGVSMKNTLLDKDIMILNKITYRFNDIKRFDIVVIKGPEEEIIKRVIGLPGDKVEYKNNKLYINGKEIKEDFAKVYDKSLDSYNIEELGSTTVPKGYYFVLGDNRPKSADSRIIGFIKKEDIIGKAEYTIFPFNRIGKKK